jgi:hypothetical protein
MKIRKFNESVDDEIRYIEECLVELYDSYDVRKDGYSGKSFFNMRIDITVDGYDSDNMGFDLSSFTLLSNTISDITDKIDEGISKIKTKYDYTYSFDIYKNDSDEDTYYYMVYFIKN